MIFMAGMSLLRMREKYFLSHFHFYNLSDPPVMDASDNLVELNIGKKSKKIRTDSSGPHNKHSRSENTKNSKWKRSKESDNSIYKKDD